MYLDTGTSTTLVNSVDNGIDSRTPPAWRRIILRHTIRRIRRSSGVQILATATLVLAGFRADPVAGQERSFQLSFINPVQIHSEDQAIKGVRLSLLYGRNTDVTGLDASFLVNHVTGDFEGVQLGIVGLNDGDSAGWQANGINISKGHFYGLQSALYNQTLTGRGLQLGWVNHSKGNYRGLQISFVNYAQSINGVQIGVINIIREGGQFPFFPIVNWGKN
jgi:hypothetical protein